MGGAGTRELRVDVVMPAYQAAGLLDRTLGAVMAALRGGRAIVVDPGSSDGTAERARALGATVIELGRRAGPAEARNVGVQSSDADVVLFIDSDCVAHADVVERVGRAFAERPDLVSLTGSYDDTPEDPGFFSLYMNLRHHHVHQHARQENATFWAGCGAVRRETFLRIGGFDAQRYPRPMIEDIELGGRLAEHGRTALDPQLHVKHLKRWTLRSVVTTDVFCRAVPWTKLILERGQLPNDLNLAFTQRLAAVVAPVFLLALVGSPAWITAFGSAALTAIGVLALLALVLNFGLFAFFTRKRHVMFAVFAWLFHQVHLTYSLVTFAWLKLTYRVPRTMPS